MKNVKGLPVIYVYEKPPTEEIVILNSVLDHPDAEQFLEHKKQLKSSMIQSGLRKTKQDCKYENDSRIESAIDNSTHNYNRTDFSEQRNENLQRIKDFPITVDHYIIGDDVKQFIKSANLSQYHFTENYTRFDWIENHANNLTSDERNRIAIAGEQAKLRRSIYSHFEHFDNKKDRALHSLVNSLPELIEMPDMDVDERLPYVTINFKSVAKKTRKTA